MFLWRRRLKEAITSGKETGAKGLSNFILRRAGSDINLDKLIPGFLSLDYLYLVFLDLKVL
jgi:hypothetical protein